MAVGLTCLTSVLAVLLAGPAGAAAVTPVEKVITLLEDLRTKVQEEGSAEAKTYDEFACFCKDTTKQKSEAILEGQDNIESLSSEVAMKTAEVEETVAEVKERKAHSEATQKELSAMAAQRAKEEAAYEAHAADLSKAIASLEGAIKALEDAKPGALLQAGVRQSVEKGLAMAEAMSLIDVRKREAVSTFLQVADPDDPEYEFHSQGIIDILQKLLADFRANKSEIDAEWEKAKKSFADQMSKLQASLEENEHAITAANELVETRKMEIAEAQEALLNAESMLKDDQHYLKDLTKRCEARALDWDQRTKMRADEVEAITQALEIITGSVQGLDEQVNERALLEVHATPRTRISLAGLPTAPAFLQTALSPRTRARALLQGARGSSKALSADDARRAEALRILATEGKRLASSALTSLASQIGADPFVKIKRLIQQLIERLLRESASEATKKGFCDTELGKATTDRDHRYAEVKKLNSELAQLEVKKAELKEEIELLAGSIAEVSASLDKATKLRADEKASNLKTIEDAKEGAAAVKEAIKVLKAFYKKAGKAALLQASPVDEDTEGAGFEGSYSGKQTQAKGIIGLLEVIAADFERTLKTTTAAEDASAKDFVTLDRSSKVDVGGKETKKTLNEQDLVTTESSITRKMDDLGTQQALLDDALKAIEELKPACIDTGMSYEERVAKREEEIEALKKALCILDTDGVEPDCA